MIENVSHRYILLTTHTHTIKMKILIFLLFLSHSSYWPKEPLPLLCVELPDSQMVLPLGLVLIQIPPGVCRYQHPQRLLVSADFIDCDGLWGLLGCQQELVKELLWHRGRKPDMARFKSHLTFNTWSCTCCPCLTSSLYCNLFSYF